jgi:hypothetical protein
MLRTDPTTPSSSSSSSSTVSHSRDQEPPPRSLRGVPVECDVATEASQEAEWGPEARDVLWALLRQSCPHCQMCAASQPAHNKWRISLAAAQLDSYRQTPTLAEISGLRWQLWYKGELSTSGLREFQASGRFTSPHLGETAWFVDKMGFHIFGFPPFSFERDAKTWGWVLRGILVKYCSVDVRKPWIVIPGRVWVLPH